MAEDGKDEKVRVVDRRWFTAEGDLKETEPRRTDQAPPAGTPPVQPPANAPAAVPQRAKGDDGETPVPKAGFMDLVDFLAQQAVALLSGQVPGRGRDPEMARFFIDLLGVVEEKTAGRLAPEEARYLDDVLYQLRSLFVAAQR